MKQIQAVREEDLNLRPPDYKSSTLTTRPQHVLYIYLTLLSTLLLCFLIQKQSFSIQIFWRLPSGLLPKAASHCLGQEEIWVGQVLILYLTCPWNKYISSLYITVTEIMKKKQVETKRSFGIVLCDYNTLIWNMYHAFYYASKISKHYQWM